MPERTSPSTGALRWGTARGLLLPGVFVLAGAALRAAPRWASTPVRQAAAVPAWATDTRPIRHPRLRPEIDFAGYTYRCSECHNLFVSPPETTRSLTMHKEIVLKHGINTRCFNCHHPTRRDAFVDDWGREIPYDAPQLLCAKCHGPVYRDWTHGSHGRTNGYWDPRRGPMQRLKCVSCHDPHQPPFPPMPPAPPPDTLRMGDQSIHEDHAAPRNPLQVYQRLDSPEAAQSSRPAPSAGLNNGEAGPWTPPEAEQTTRPRVRIDRSGRE